MDNSNSNILTPEHQEVLDNADKYSEQYKLTPVHLNRLCSMVADLYIDKHKFKGVNVKAKLPALFEKLNQTFSNPESFVEFFNAF